MRFLSLLNPGDYSEARDHFEMIVESNPSADYAYYGLAALDSITGQERNAWRIWRRQSS